LGSSSEVSLRQTALRKGGRVGVDIQIIAGPSNNPSGAPTSDLGHDELRTFLRSRSRMRRHVPAATAIALGVLEAA